MLGFKSSFGLLLAITVFGLAPAQNDQETRQLEKYFHDKCLNTSRTQKTFDELRTDVYELYKYFQLTFHQLPNNRKEFCNQERSNLMYRAAQVNNDLQQCLSSNEKFLGDFFEASFKEFLHFFCHNDGQYTTRVFGQQGEQCWQKIKARNDTNVDNCLNRIFGPTKGSITKSELCDGITVTRKCFERLVQDSCPTSVDVKQLPSEFFSYVSKPCSGCSLGINYFILTGLLCFIFVTRR